MQTAINHKVFDKICWNFVSTLIEDWTNFCENIRSKTLKTNPTGPLEIGSRKKQQSEAND